jgi:4-hydroxy-3-methylbut-2-enyl diphosphate reductase
VQETGAARASRLHARRYDLRIRAERLEERAPLRAGRFTSVIHGKVHHEETRATASQAPQRPNGHYLIVRDREEAEIAANSSGTAAIPARSRSASRKRSPRVRSRVAPPAHRLRQSDDDADGGIAGHRRDVQARDDRPLRRSRSPPRFRAFDTICSATQERQDAVVTLLDRATLDLAVVIGGYNSSNTCNLARMCAERVPTYHIADPSCLVSADQIQHRPIGAPSTSGTPERVTRDWLPATGPVRVGLTAAPRRPINLVGEAISRLERFTSQ